MFRPATLQAQTRLQALRSYSDAQRSLPKWSLKEKQTLEETSAFTLSEKIELLTLFSGHKMTTEIFQNIDSQKNEIEKALSDLPLLYSLEHFTKRESRSQKSIEIIWFQVSVNRATHEFVTKFSDTLDEYSEGILYGYPETAIRAFCGLIEESSETPQTPWSYFLGGVFSQRYKEAEDAYYLSTWNKLRILSPLIIAEAERCYTMRKKER